MDINLRFLDKAGSFGALLSAMACPVCFPLFSVLGSILGVGVLFPFEEKTIVYIFMFFVVVALIGNLISYFHHRKLLPLLIGVSGTLSVFYGIFFSYNKLFLYAGVIALLTAAVLNYVESRWCDKCELKIENGDKTGTE